MPKMNIWIYRPDKFVKQEVDPEYLFTPSGMPYYKQKELEAELLRIGALPRVMMQRGDHQVEVPG